MNYAKYTVKVDCRAHISDYVEVLAMFGVVKMLGPFSVLYTMLYVSTWIHIHVLR